MYSKGLRVNESMWIKKFWNTSKLARTLFPVESENDIKIKIGVTKFKVRVGIIGDGCVWEKLSLAKS